MQEGVSRKSEGVVRLVGGGKGKKEGMEDQRMETCGWVVCYQGGGEKGMVRGMALAMRAGMETA